jgi:hypothetical protein
MLEKHSLRRVTLALKSKEIKSQTSFTLSISYLKSLWENIDIIHEPHHLNLQAPRLKHVLLKRGSQTVGGFKGTPARDIKRQ